MGHSRQSGEYLPKVLRRIDWLQLDISRNVCDSCGKWAEHHKWGILDSTGQTMIYCDITHEIRTTPIENVTMGPNAGIVYV